MGTLNEINTKGDVHLNSDLEINNGQLRVCYQHPGDPSLVIKIASGNRAEGQRANLNEYKGYSALIRKHSNLSFISHCHGFVDTNLGKGLLCDCIRDEDGAISKTIWDYVIYEEECDVAYIQEIVRKFCDFLITENVRLFDLNLKNIALRLEGSGSFRIFVIDLKGMYDNQELIPISNYFAYFSRKKLKRRSRQLIDRIYQFRERREELQKSDL